MIPDFHHNIRIRLVRLIFFCCFPDFALSLPWWQFSWASQQGRHRARAGCNKIILNGPIFSYIMMKVWYHQIWIQNNLGFIVLILIYILWHSSRLKIPQNSLKHYTRDYYIIHICKYPRLFYSFFQQQPFYRRAKFKSLSHCYFTRLNLKKMGSL